MSETPTESKPSGALVAMQILDQDRGLRRRLRKVDPDNPVAALYLQGTHDALGALAKDGLSHQDRALDALLLLAHLDRHTAGRLGQQIRAADVKPERFRRLADADRGEALDHLRRMIQQCKGMADAPSVARAGYWWGIHGKEGIRTAKEQLAHEYYNYTKKEEQK